VAPPGRSAVEQLDAVATDEEFCLPTDPKAGPIGIRVKTFTLHPPFRPPRVLHFVTKPFKLSRALSWSFVSGMSFRFCPGRTISSPKRNVEFCFPNPDEEAGVMVKVSQFGIIS